MKSHLKAKFIADASIPDGTKLQPDEEVNIKDLININVDVVCNNIEHGVWSFLFCQLQLKWNSKTKVNVQSSVSKEHYNRIVLLELCCYPFYSLFYF